MVINIDAIVDKLKTELTNLFAVSLPEVFIESAYCGMNVDAVNDAASMAVMLKIP